MFIKIMSQELDTLHCAINFLYITTLEILSHMFCKTFPFFYPKSMHSHVQAHIFSHEVKKKIRKTIKELSIIQLIKNSFN